MSSTDKAALLAAINSSVQAPKSQSKNQATRDAQGLQQRGINQRMAHDLVSNASRQVDMREVQPQGYQHQGLD